jgi:hypothetical protein
MNALHAPDFHKDWAAQGLIAPNALAVSVLRSPIEYNIQILPRHLKERVSEKYQEHIALTPGLDAVTKSYYQAALNYMNSRDQSAFLSKFRGQTRNLDRIRCESFSDVFPELAELMDGPPRDVE